MRIQPLFKLTAESAAQGGEGRDEGLTSVVKYSCNAGRKAVVLCLDGLVLPPGTPKYSKLCGVEVIAFRGEVNHFHCVDGETFVETGIDPRGYVVAVSKRLGKGRRALRAFLAQYPPIDVFVLQHRLRDLVRKGD